MWSPVLCLAAVLAASPAGPPRDQQHALFAVGVGTDFPLSVGLNVRSELGPRLQLGAGVGYLPRPYLRLINKALVEFDAYDDRTATLIESALKDALVWRAQVGWRPFSRSGFYVTGGYLFMGLGGSVTGSDALYAFTGFNPPGELLDRVDLDVTARAHGATLELGWRWRPGARLAFELAVGGFATLSANSEIQADANVLNVLGAPLLNAGEEALTDTLESNLHGGFASLRGYFEVFLCAG